MNKRRAKSASVKEKKVVGKVKCYPTLPTKTDKHFNLKQETGEIRIR